MLLYNPITAALFGFQCCFWGVEWRRERVRHILVSLDVCQFNNGRAPLHGAMNLQLVDFLLLCLVRD